jgi:hypothetical protein
VITRAATWLPITATCSQRGGPSRPGTSTTGAGAGAAGSAGFDLVRLGMREILGHR